MKKIIMALIFATCMVIPALAQSNSESQKPVWDHGDNVSDYTYYTAPIYKIMQSKDAYVIFYQQQNLSVATAVLPKSWQKTGENKKLYFRNKAAGLDSYVTVFYKAGEFHHVVVTVNPDVRDPVWAVAPAGAKIEADGVETLDIKF